MRREGKKDPRLDSRVNHTDPFSFHTFDSAAAGRGDREMERERERKRNRKLRLFSIQLELPRASYLDVRARERKRNGIARSSRLPFFRGAPLHID